MSTQRSSDRASGPPTSRHLTWSLAAVLGFLAIAAQPARAQYDESWDSVAVVGIFPREPLRSLSISVTVSTNYGIDPAGSNVCTLLVEGAKIAYESPGLFKVRFVTSSPYEQSQAVLYCNYYTHEPNLGMGFDFHLVEATDIDGHDVLQGTAMCLTQLDEDNPSHTLDSRWLCGDASEDESVGTSDALAVLRAAVGAASCERKRCDADGDGSIAPSDALRVLQFAVGRDVSLLCSACEP
jgi:hypothetical protein